MIWNEGSEFKLEQAQLYNNERWGALTRCDHHPDEWFYLSEREEVQSPLCYKCFFKTRCDIFVTVYYCLRGFLMKDIIKMICDLITFPLEPILFTKDDNLGLFVKNHNRKGKIRKIVKALDIPFRNVTQNFQILDKFLRQVFPNVQFINFINEDTDLSEDGQEYVQDATFQSFCEFVALSRIKYLQVYMFFSKYQLKHLLTIMPNDSLYTCRSFYSRECICSGTKKISFLSVCYRDKRDDLFAQAEDDSSFDLDAALEDFDDSGEHMSDVDDHFEEN